MQEVVATDPDIMRLPHPLRVPLSTPDLFRMQKSLFGPAEWSHIEACLKKADCVLSQVSFEMTESGKAPILSGLVGMLEGAYGNTEQGSAYAMLIWMRYLLLNYTHFQLEDRLVEMLEHTDIDDALPVSCLVPPYPLTYVELGTSREVKVALWNEDSGEHRLEGAYIEMGYHRDVPKALNVVLTGSPVGHSHATDDTVMSVLLSLEDLNRPLNEALETAFHRQREQVLAQGMRAASEKSIGYTLASLKLVAKALLYINLPEARKVPQLARTELAAQLNGLKSPAKRAKLERKIARVHDRIVVLGPTLPTAEADLVHPGNPGHRRAHWRRGHYRMQAHGPRMQLRKLIFIRPVLVAAHEGAAPAPPDYLVR